MELKLLNYSIFITESELKRIGEEQYKLIKETANIENIKNIKKDLNSFTLNSFQDDHKRKAVNTIFINRTSASRDMTTKLCSDMNKEDKDICSHIIASEMEMNNTELLISVLSGLIKNFNLNKLKLIIKKIEIIKNKLSNNEQLNEEDIKFNEWLTKLVYTTINKYYQGISIETLIAKLTTTYVYEKDLVLKKIK